MPKVTISTIKPFSSYRSGAPWAARLYRLAKPHAGEYKYGMDKTKGIFEGTPESGGKICVDAKPGELIAWGQQGVRYNDTHTKYGRISEDLRVETLAGKDAAYAILDGMPADDEAEVAKELAAKKAAEARAKEAAAKRTAEAKAREEAAKAEADKKAAEEKAKADAVAAKIAEQKKAQTDMDAKVAAARAEKEKAKEEAKGESSVNPLGHD